MAPPAKGPKMTATLSERIGPLPGYAWLILVVVGTFAYLYYRNKKKQAAAAAAAAAQQQQQMGSSSNLGTVPVSNLTTQAQPMPIQLGDTFIQNGGAGGMSSNGVPNTTLITPGGFNPGGTMIPATPPAPSPAVQV